MATGCVQPKMAEIQLIVEKLNAPPFNKAFTLVRCLLVVAQQQRV